MNASSLLSIFQSESNCLIVANTFIATSPLLPDAILIRNVTAKRYRKLNDHARSINDTGCVYFARNI